MYKPLSSRKSSGTDQRNSSGEMAFISKQVSPPSHLSKARDDISRNKTGEELIVGPWMAVVDNIPVDCKGINQEK